MKPDSFNKPNASNPHSSQKPGATTGTTDYTKKQGGWGTPSADKGRSTSIGGGGKAPYNKDDSRRGTEGQR